MLIHAGSRRKGLHSFESSLTTHTWLTDQTFQVCRILIQGTSGHACSNWNWAFSWFCFKMKNSFYLHSCSLIPNSRERSVEPTNESFKIPLRPYCFWIAPASANPARLTWWIFIFLPYVCVRACMCVSVCVWYLINYKASWWTFSSNSARGRAS